MIGSLLTKIDFNESTWSGGSTTQLYIFPEDASYAERNFQFRISTAKVEVAESTFTSLPSFSRKLMILEGEITVHHKNQYTKRLKPFDVDTFSGDWNTSAVGTCVDFNVMTTGTIQSELTSVELAAKVVLQLSGNEHWSMLFLYPLDEGVKVEMNQERIQVDKGNLFCVQELGSETIELSAENTGRIVLVRIKL
jgi:uncharacterized protein